MAGTSYTTKTLGNGVNALVGGRAGTPIVCLPGWPQTAEAFDEIFPLLADSHHVLVLDLPGLGDSSPSTNGYDTKAISSTLAKVVDSELGPSTRYHLVGHDVGAWIAYSWAAQYGSSLLSLTLIDSSIPGLVVLPEYPLPDAPNIKLWQFAFNRLPELPEILTEGRERQLLDWLFDQKSAHPERITPAKRDRYVSCYSRPGAMSNGFAYYRAIPENMSQNREVFSARKLQMPVLAIGGQQAAGEMMKTTLGLTAKSLESKFVAIADCGHYVMEEQPEVTAREILAFVAEIETL
jgi:pimeloyl-ACP methyl ester carboxylesterase